MGQAQGTMKAEGEKAINLEKPEDVESPPKDTEKAEWAALGQGSINS